MEKTFQEILPIMGEVPVGRRGSFLPSFYLPPISWFAAFKSGEPIAIEVNENFQKQTLRNRCYIDSPNGRLALSIPIDKSNFSDRGKCLMRDIQLSHQLNWQHQHWFAFETSYYNSPFFEYLQDDFRPIYEREWKYLVDLNEALVERCLSILDIDQRPSRTTEFLGVTPSAPSVPQKEYYQVYKQKHGFLPDLSIFDLLMNMGPEAALYL